MKKNLIFIIMCLAALTMGSCKDDDFTETNNDINSSEYVDLGLPSGTKWKLSNEVNPSDSLYDLFTWDEAMAIFGDKMPTKDQLTELKTYCIWTWNANNGTYKVEGNNGNYIILPALGVRDSYYTDGRVTNEGSVGFYWSSSTMSSVVAYSLRFNSNEIVIDCHGKTNGHSIRLVQN